MCQVRDHGTPPRQAQAAVIINVADVNDNAPQIDITLPPGGTNVAESIEVVLCFVFLVCLVSSF